VESGRLRARRHKAANAQYCGQLTGCDSSAAIALHEMNKKAGQYRPSQGWKMDYIPVPQNCLYERAVFFDGNEEQSVFPNCRFVERVSSEARYGVNRACRLRHNDVKEAVNLPGPVLVIEKATKAAVLDVGNTILQ
jgi:hypothetical protein